MAMATTTPPTKDDLCVVWRATATRIDAAAQILLNELPRVGRSEQKSKTTLRN